MTRFDVSLRLAHPAEAETIACWSRELIEQGLRWRWTASRVAAGIRAPNVNVLVACAPDGIAGFGIMRYGKDDAHLDLLGVIPRFRGSGIGKRLLRWLEECALVGGNFDVQLEVRAGNEPAQLFYGAMGYSTIAHIPGYYDGIEGAYRMRRDLSGGRAASPGRDVPRYLSPDFPHRLPPVRRTW
jgi:ribosomal-protein-alanine N-acetyltransferase